MFARRLYVHLKPNSVAEFAQRLDKEIAPLLRKEKGFHDEISFVGQGERKRSESVCGVKPRTRRLTTAGPTQK
jgi:hypothetical protein